MKRSSIHVSRMLKNAPKLVLGAITVAILSACGDSTPTAPETFASNVDDCNGMKTREQVSQCEASYYNALNKASKELPRFTSAEECERIYGACERPAGAKSDDNSILVPLMAGYIASQMVNDLGSGFRNQSYYYQQLDLHRKEMELEKLRRKQAERERDDAIYGGSTYAGGSSTTYTRNSSTNTPASTNWYKPRPKVAPPPKSTASSSSSNRGGFSGGSAHQNSWSSGSSGG